MNELRTYKLIRFEPQELIDIGALLILAYGSAEVKSLLKQEYGISEDRLGELADKIRKQVNGL